MLLRYSALEWLLLCAYSIACHHMHAQQKRIACVARERSELEAKESLAQAQIAKLQQQLQELQFSYEQLELAVRNKDLQLAKFQSITEKEAARPTGLGEVNKTAKERPHWDEQDEAFGRAWPQQWQQGNQGIQPAKSQGAHSSMQPLVAGTQFIPWAFAKSQAVAHRPPSVGLQNEGNTCYMNSFLQGLFLTDAFLWHIYNFNLKLKTNPCKMDEEDYKFGKKVVELLQKQFAKMALTKHQHTDICDILQAFPEEYRSGEQQDVTETMRFVFDKLGGSDQQLLKEVFAGQLHEKTQCKECRDVKVRQEAFTDLVVPVPTAEEVEEMGCVPTIQKLLEERLKFEELDAECLVHCDRCKKKTRVGKWTEIASHPAHLCLCLNRLSFNREKMDFTKEKTPVKVDEGLWIGDYEYELYHTIIHTGEDASSGHYYATGRRSEPPPSGNKSWYIINDSHVKPAEAAEASLLAGNPPEELVEDNAYVLFLRCKQAPQTPELRVPLSLVNYVKKEDRKQQQNFDVSPPP